MCEILQNFHLSVVIKINVTHNSINIHDKLTIYYYGNQLLSEFRICRTYLLSNIVFTRRKSTLNFNCVS